MIEFTLNGQSVAVDAPDDRPLSQILREDLGATGTKTACDIGRCGACTVLIDGAPVNSCLIMGWRVAGRSVTTIEGLATHPAGAALHAGLTAENAFQCGYCAPGMVMTLAGTLGANPDLGEDDLLRAIEGNICRCTGYHSILRGAKAAAALLKA